MTDVTANDVSGIGVGGDGTAAGQGGVPEWAKVSARCAARIWRRDARTYLRVWYEHAFPQSFEPIFYLLGIGLGVGALIDQDVAGVPFVEYVAPGLAAIAAINASSFELSYLVFIKLKLLMQYESVITTPIEPQDIAIGELSWGVTRGIVLASVFLAITTVLGYTSGIGLLAAPLAFAVIAFAFGSMALLFATIIGRIDFMSYYFTLVLMPMFLLSGTFFPVSQLPEWGQVVVWFLPTHHAVECVRQLTAYQDWAAAAGHALWLMVLSAVLLPIAVRRFWRSLVG